MKKDSILPTEAEILHALRDINPFWINKDWPDLPAIRRYPFYSAISYLQELGSQRAIFFRGFRGVGKSTLLRQMGVWLRNEQEIKAWNIVYVDFEKRPLRQIPWNVWFNTWEKELKPSEGLVYFLLDEIQYADGWVQEVRSLLVNPRYRIVATGSAAAEIQTALDQEVRRWISLHVPALLFHEYLLIFHPQEYAKIENDILKGQVFFEKGIFDAAEMGRVFDTLKDLFKNYLLRGGFPEVAKTKLSLPEVQRVLTDVVDKALYQDMRTQFSRQDIENLERLLEYVCRNPGVLLDKSKVSETLEVSRPTTARYVKALDDGDFIRSLSNHNRGGKKALKAKPKLYPADASLRNAVLGRTEEVLNQPEEMGHIVEGVVATHLSAYAQAEGGQVGYWRKNDNEEVDFIYQRTDGKYWVIESKYGQPDPKWLRAFIQWSKSERERVSSCFLVNRDKTGIGDRTPPTDWPLQCRLNVVPAPVFLYLLSRELWMKANINENSVGSMKANTGALTGKVEVGEVRKQQ
ncbi:MAG: ATP-binding protein [Candidatus Omnitrophica bacterium]|nr:ATP-binding protein [Candidatus Omnitrophota bacterium]